MGSSIYVDRDSRTGRVFYTCEGCRAEWTTDPFADNDPTLVQIDAHAKTCEAVSDAP